MFQWLPYPFLRILLFFISGMVAAFYTTTEISTTAGILLLAALFLLFLVTGKVRFLRNYAFAGFTAFFFIALTGFLHVKNHLNFPPPVEGSTFIMATVTGYPEEKENSLMYLARVHKTSHDGQEWVPADRKILLYTDKNTALDYGEVIVAKAALQVIGEPKNPGEFNYKAYLLNQRIEARAYISSDNLMRTGRQGGSPVIQTAFKVRAWVENVVDVNFHPKEASIMKALLVGIRSDMDDKLKKDYAAAGAVHILAVSGLHVGIVYGLLLWTLGWLRNSAYGKIIFAGAAFLLLWFYAFVTGFSPSILRAVLMFSFIIVSQVINRGSNIYNAIAASAFLLLCIDPLLIRNVGFQLSYMAVLGIVYLYPRIVWLLEVDNIFLDRVWQITVVGLAAQIATAPIVLYYFHQFPTFFLFSNLIVVPAASLILCSGLLFLAVQWWALLAGWVAQLISWIISFMNGAVRLIAELPLSTIGEIYLSEIQFLALAIFLLGMVLLFTRKRFTLFWLSTLSGTLFIASGVYEAALLSKEKVIQFYSIPGQTRIDFIAGRQLFTYSSDTLADNEFYVGANRERRHSKPDPLPAGLHAVYRGNELIWWNSNRIWIINNDIPKFDNMDYVLIEKNAVSEFNKLLSFTGKKIILGTGNSRGYCRKFMKFVRDKGLPVHDLNESSLAIKL